MERKKNWQELSSRELVDTALQVHAKLIDDYEKACSGIEDPEFRSIVDESLGELRNYMMPIRNALTQRNVDGEKRTVLEGLYLIIYGASQEDPLRVEGVIWNYPHELERAFNLEGQSPASTPQ